jgi:hypothetical protein
MVLAFPRDEMLLGLDVITVLGSENSKSESESAERRRESSNGEDGGDGVCVAGTGWRKVDSDTAHLSAEVGRALNQACDRIWGIVSLLEGSFWRIFLIKSRASERQSELEGLAKEHTIT